MTNAARLTAVMLVLALSAVACTQGTVELSGQDDGSTQTLSRGQELKISLESNQTTGYRWAVDGEVPSQLEQVGEPTYEAESDLVGAGGTEVWVFKAVARGQGELRLKYWRSFEPTAAPADTFEVSVDVK